MEPSSGMSSDVTEETTSFGDVRSSSEEEVHSLKPNSDPFGLNQVT